ncbi:hypothetical protein BT93_A0220 [Corymbia citriodora subsp. variegata]|nr:hypothetical protein BT93_A0220 [Corymbia citriodora subsp. variegata]
MAAAGMPLCSLKYPRPSFSHKTLQNPHLNRLFRTTLTSNLSFVAQSKREFVAKARSLSNCKLNSRSPLSIRKSDEPIIVIDNYDGFTYNLCQYLGELECKFEVYRNDELTVEELKSKKPRGVLISPGPGTPQNSGISLQTVLELGPVVPLFGVCMVYNALRRPLEGRLCVLLMAWCTEKVLLCIMTRGDKMAYFLDYQTFTAGRYHSLVTEKESFPGEVLEVTAWTEDGLIMAVRHKTYKHIQGVQFHPESILTDEGKTIVRNFLRIIETKEAEAQT